jgi:hypothetical protein
MRRLRIAAPSQRSLMVPPGEVPRGLPLWTALPDAAREQVLVLLARLIARGVIATEDQEPTR